MTTPTNWPNPERPGVPLFPERDGWHLVEFLGAEKPMKWFHGNRIAPWMTVRGLRLSAFELSQMRHTGYIGPVLTPTQITEMLAGERERCAKKAEEYKLNANARAPSSWDAVRTSAANSIAREIRNLGDAP